MNIVVFTKCLSSKCLGFCYNDCFCIFLLVLSLLSFELVSCLFILRSIKTVRLQRRFMLKQYLLFLSNSIIFFLSKLVNSKEFSSMLTSRKYAFIIYLLVITGLQNTTFMSYKSKAFGT